MTTRRRLTRRQFDRWFLLRYDTLTLEGFTPEESNFLSNFKISTAVMRRLRRQRKREVQRYMDEGYSFYDALDLVRDAARRNDEEILEWSDFITEAYFRA